jgi:3-methyladenine DNA glycosylase AlkD
VKRKTARQPGAQVQRYVNEVVAVLGSVADPERAIAMAKYMKDHFPFLGVASPARRTAVKPLAAPPVEDVLPIANALWTLEEREYQYTAVDLLARFAKKLDPAEALQAIRSLTVSKSWWDSVDGLASVASDVVRANPSYVSVVEQWNIAADFWLNRLAILNQNGWGSETDESRLFQTCLGHASNQEFFIRKAIGWALRDYAWSNARAVQHFIATHRGEFSPLTIREALKNVGNG